MKTFIEKYSEKEVLWNKGLQKTLVKIHESNLWGNLLLMLPVMYFC